MLTRLKISGFKNLVDVDVRFGPFTCIAGANGVGKSNLFDAINFLSALADRPLIDAAMTVRDEGGRTTDVRSLFHRVESTYAPHMDFVAEMIIPATGDDDLGQEARASTTFLRYSLTLAYRQDDSRPLLGALEILKEELTHINQGDALNALLFRPSPAWRRSAISGRRTAPYFISTEADGPVRLIKLHQDGGGGRPLTRAAANLPRTVLSVVNAAESPTATLARREMQSWRLLQLEPSALRRPDDFRDPPRIGADGSHLAATLYHLAHQTQHGDSEAQTAARVYGTVAARLAELISDVRDVCVERDEKRELLTVVVQDLKRTGHPARALSDGTLRFLALAVIELDPAFQGLICLEEPENGIHPMRIPAMLRLLRDIATDTRIAVDESNSLRQVIVNTHSPAVVAQVPDDSLLVAQLREDVKEGRRYSRVQFSCLPQTWRTRDPSAIEASRGSILSYLNPVPTLAAAPRFGDETGPGKSGQQRPRRVVDRDDMQMMIPFASEA